MRALVRWGAAHFRRIYLAGLIVGFGLVLWEQRSSISGFDWQGSWAAFALAALLFGSVTLVCGTGFWLILRDLTRGTPFGDGIAVWARSSAARYVPSGALTMAVRLHEREQLGASTAQIWSASAYEQLVSTIGGAAACVAAFELVRREPPIGAPIILVLAVVLGLAARPVLRRLGKVAIVMRSRVLAGVVLLNAAGWLVSGVAVWVFTDQITAHRGPGFLVLLGAYSFAWLIGFIVPFVPSGLGLREAILIAMLAPHFGTGGAAALAVGLRLANITGDLVGLGAIQLAAVSAGRLRTPRAIRIPA